ncbi:MAG TPA: DUF2024 family protein [Cyclobacteriaceae bacterium]|jgi:hypothetical protein|nr:DUF2024 family protein [Cyclobacteriaceae bacterium]HRK52822.1 DUF2024 family protein [Cyclobacteriaceae bacterium]
MKVAVWDTYVTRDNGEQMHFDILVPSELKDENVIYNYGKAFLKIKPFKVGELTSKECRFCHIEQATPDVVAQIEKVGYAIVEMENCD